MHPQPSTIAITPNGIRELPVASNDPLEIGLSIGIPIALKWAAGYAALVGIGITGVMFHSLASSNWASTMAAIGSSVITGMMGTFLALLVGAPIALPLGGMAGLFVGLVFKRMAYSRLEPRNAILWGGSTGLVFMSALHILYIFVWQATTNPVLADFVAYLLANVGNQWWWAFVIGPTLAAIAGCGEIGYRINQRLPRRERWSDYN